MTSIPRRSITRTARLAALPLRFAGRAASGAAQRAVGVPAETVTATIRQRTAEHLFQTLGQLKAGAMKVGQMMSVLEVLLPDAVGAAYRAALARLQESAPPLPVGVVRDVLAAEFGAGWRADFRDFDPAAAAAASLGQVHRAVWRDGREVAVKVQYPGIRQALTADLDQISRLSALFRILHPTFEIKPIVAELRRRLTEELDYRLESRAQRTFAAAYADDDEIAVPRVVRASGRVLITEWIEGEPLATVIAAGSQEQRDRAGRLLATLHFSGPARAGLLHADPHPGNFRLLPDGRLGVLDFGAVARLPDGLPHELGALVCAAVDGDAPRTRAVMCDVGLLADDSKVTAEAALQYVRPALLPVFTDGFRFDRAWLRRQAVRMTASGRVERQVSRSLQLPPSYLLIHRVTLGTVAMLCQLEAAADYGTVIGRWLPGFAPA